MRQKKENDIHRNILSIPLGYSEVIYQSKKYSITRVDFNKGKSLKVFAQELGGTDFISFNYYLLSKSNTMKPCEMPMKKVIDFLERFKIVTGFVKTSLTID